MMSSSRHALQTTLRTSAPGTSAAFQKVLKTLRNFKPVLELMLKLLVETNVIFIKVSFG